MRVLYTIGYEGSSMATFLAALAEAGVTQLVDVRQAPVSRKPGFARRALAEAMGAGLPCISFNCPYGPGQMIHHRKNGLLVRPEDVASLARSMHELAAFPDWATQLGRQAQKDIHRQLNKDHIMEQWQQLIERVI